MLASLTLAGVLALGTIGGQERSYWVECAAGMEITLMAAAAGELSGIVDEGRLASGMNKATSCTEQALHLPPSLRKKYETMLLSFLAGLEQKDQAAINSFSPTRTGFIDDLPGPPTDRDQAPAPVSESDLIASAKHRIERQLIDPESARYRDIVVIPGRLPVVCGEVNAKNSYGGYVGFRRFAAAGDTALLEDTTAQYALADAQRDVFNSLCTAP